MHLLNCNVCLHINGTSHFPPCRWCTSMASQWSLSSLVWRTCYPFFPITRWNVSSSEQGTGTDRQWICISTVCLSIWGEFVTREFNSESVQKLHMASSSCNTVSRSSYFCFNNHKETVYHPQLPESLKFVGLKLWFMGLGFMHWGDVKLCS